MAKRRTAAEWKSTLKGVEEKIEKAENLQDAIDYRLRMQNLLLADLLACLEEIRDR